MRAWEAGRIDVLSQKSILEHSIAARYRALPEGLVGDLTAARELKILLEGAVALESEDAMETVLEVAAAGLVPGKYTRQMAPYLVREAGEKAAMAFTSNTARNALVGIARGGVKLDRSRELGVRAAAMRVIGLRGEKTLRSVLERQLGVPEPVLRLAAAEGLGWLGDAAGAGALADALSREREENVLLAEVGALRSLFAPFARKPEKPKEPGDPAAGDPKPGDSTAGRDGASAVAAAPAESARLAVRAAIAALGRASWRLDMEICALLSDLRSGEAIPALIDVLQRFKDHPEEVQSGRLSGLLLHRAHELLVELTGAVFPQDQPERWRELWESEKESLTAMVEKARPREHKSEGTASKGFFGIPVQGTRVLFVIDLSGSMNFPMHGYRTASPGSKPPEAETRLDYAKREIERAVRDMPENSFFNFVTYNGNPKSKQWMKDLVQATSSNKERALKFLRAMRADGGTNMWSGLEVGIRMKSLVYGDRYETNVDEMFLVSDGAPNLGDVTDPVEILRLVTETNRFSRLRINTIFITSPNERDPVGMAITPSELMKRMAEQNGGRFVRL
ncbi:MAG: hypothetical protein Fur0037_19620 [Planctomycetota bacterium]